MIKEATPEVAAEESQPPFMLFYLMRNKFLRIGDDIPYCDNAFLDSVYGQCSRVSHSLADIIFFFECGNGHSYRYAS